MQEKGSDEMAQNCGRNWGLCILSRRGSHTKSVCVCVEGENLGPSAPLLQSKVKLPQPVVEKENDLGSSNHETLSGSQSDESW